MPFIYPPLSSSRIETKHYTLETRSAISSHFTNLSLNAEHFTLPEDAKELGLLLLISYRMLTIWTKNAPSLQEAYHAAKALQRDIHSFESSPNNIESWKKAASRLQIRILICEKVGFGLLIKQFYSSQTERDRVGVNSPLTKERCDDRDTVSLLRDAGSYSLLISEDTPAPTEERLDRDPELFNREDPREYGYTLLPSEDFDEETDSEI